MTIGEVYRRIKHAQGLGFTSEGKTNEARRCFRSVWDSAKREVKLMTADTDRELSPWAKSLIAEHETNSKAEDRE